MSEDKESVIYTDAQRTKDNIWEAYNGFRHHYNAYSMYMRTGNKQVMEHLAGMNKYADDFFFEAVDLFNTFSKEIPEETFIKFEQIINKNKKTYNDYYFIRRFCGMFTYKCGIRQIEREKDDPHTAVGRF